MSDVSAESFGEDRERSTAADARDATVCECGHSLNTHNPSGRCLFGFNAAIAYYSEDRHGHRKCRCENYRPHEATR